jgi:hypothetical protein
LRGLFFNDLGFGFWRHVSASPALALGAIFFLAALATASTSAAPAARMLLFLAGDDSRLFFVTFQPPYFSVFFPRGRALTTAIRPHFLQLCRFGLRRGLDIFQDCRRFAYLGRLLGLPRIGGMGRASVVGTFHLAALFNHWRSFLMPRFRLALRLP